MSANRPPACKERAYIEIDLELLKETGEIKPISDPIIAPTITQKVPRGKFEITYTAELFGIMKELGNKKIDVFAYLLDHKDGNNSINATNTQIAEKTGVSRKTVIETMKILKNANLVARKNSVVMIAPNLMVKGNQLREAWLMREYTEILDENDSSIKAIDVDVDSQYSFTENGQVVQKASNSQNE